jgi:hypothetical protein
MGLHFQGGLTDAYYLRPELVRALQAARGQVRLVRAGTGEIAWHPVSHPPESFRDVLLAVHGEPTAAEGFVTDAGVWWYATGHEVPANAVYAWADLPDCPLTP